MYNYLELIHSAVVVVVCLAQNYPFHNSRRGVVGTMHSAANVYLFFQYLDLRDEDMSIEKSVKSNDTKLQQRRKDKTKHKINPNRTKERNSQDEHHQADHYGIYLKDETPERDEGCAVGINVVEHNKTQEKRQLATDVPGAIGQVS